jgi:hypothetical protein
MPHRRQVAPVPTHISQMYATSVGFRRQPYGHRWISYRPLSLVQDSWSEPQGSDATLSVEAAKSSLTNKATVSLFRVFADSEDNRPLRQCSRRCLSSPTWCVSWPGAIRIPRRYRCHPRHWRFRPPYHSRLNTCDRSISRDSPCHTLA